MGIKKTEAHKLALRVPKTRTDGLIKAHDHLKNPDSSSKPRKCSCLVCKKETLTSQLNKHISLSH